MLSKILVSFAALAAVVMIASAAQLSGVHGPQTVHSANNGGGGPKRLAAARRSIRAAHCSLGRVRRTSSPKSAGRVISQSPRPGLRKPAGTKVKLVVSKGRR
jgi:beta-lactam-binding protein with PASTA domain